MGAIRLSCGVEIPNGDFEWKSDGAGHVNAPDGWVRSTQYISDESAGNLTTYWEPLWIAVAAFDGPAWGSGRAMRIALKKEAVVSNNRYIDSPLSPINQVFGAEQLVPGFEWKYRLRWWFSGSAPELPADGDTYLSVYATDTARTLNISCYTYNIPGADYLINVGEKWAVRETALFTLPSTGWGAVQPQHLFVRVVPKAKTNGATGSYLSSAFAHFTLETLGPVDSGYDSAPPSLQQPAVGYYSMSKPPLYRGMKPTMFHAMGKSTRQPSGRMRYHDPSGGIVRRTWEYEHKYLTRLDVEKLWRLWRANKGYPSDSGTRFGNPLPLVLLPNQPDEVSLVAQSPILNDQYPPKAYYVDFDGEEFPVTEYDGQFQPATDATQFYRATLRFVER